MNPWDNIVATILAMEPAKPNPVRICRGNAKKYEKECTEKKPVGVRQLPGGNFIAYGCSQGEQKIMYRGPSEEEALKARQAWFTKMSGSQLRSSKE